MKIGIDARFFGPIGKGLGRYTQKLIEHLERSDFENRYFIFLGKENFDTYEPKNPNFQKVLADCKWYTFREQVMMPMILNRFKLDLVHFPHFNVPLFYFKPFVITIHDLILIHFPTMRASTLSPLKYYFKFLGYKLAIFSAIVRAKSIITVSEFTKKDILNNYKTDGNKIHVTYEACEDMRAKVVSSGDDILKKYGIMKPYILYVGNAYPHKNLEALTDAFSGFRENGRNTNLVLVGKEDYFYARLKEHVKEHGIEGIIFPGFVEDVDLAMIYENARAYVFPSLYEGFGLPPLEAMSAGVPVASSDHACMKEILECAAIYFNGKDQEDMIHSLDLVCNDQELRNKLIQRGYIQANKYSWQRMADETSSIYADAVKHKQK